MNSKENGMTSEISLSKDLIDVKAHENHSVSVLKPYLFVPVCLLMELHWNLKVCCLSLSLFFFLQNLGFHIGSVAYTWTFTVLEGITFSFSVVILILHSALK